MQRTPVEAGTPMGSSPAHQGLRIGVLGPLELHQGPADRTPTAPMALRLLAVLLLHANRAVPVTALIDELWDGTAPRRARQAVQTYVHQLRRALGTPAPGAGAGTGVGAGTGAGIETLPGGYLLRLRPGQFDLWAFQGAVARARRDQEQGDDRGAAETLRAALGLWRGPAFAGIEAGPLLAAHVAQLDDARTGALELRIAADLRLGRHRAVLGELMGLTVAHPHSEEFTAQLMTAAYRAGHRATALDAFRRLRRTLADDLGIDPSQRLHALHQDVLTQSPRLDLPGTAPVRPRTPADSARPPAPAPPAPAPPAPAPEPAPKPAAPAGHPAVPSQLPADTADFTGRAGELRQVLGLARTPSGGGGAPTVIVLGGTAGAGKTALAVHAAHALKDPFPDGRLYAALHGPDDRPLDPSDVLHALLQATGARPEDIPATADGRARAFCGWAAERALLLLLDDAAGTEQVLPLLPGSGRSAVLVTSRVRLGGLPGARTLAVGPMAAADAARLFTDVTHRTAGLAIPEPGTGTAAEAAAGGAGAAENEAEAAAVDRIVRLCGRLPLAVRAAAEQLAARPARTAAGLAARLTDDSARLAELRSDVFDIAARLRRALDRLPPADRQSLRLLAAAGPGPHTPQDAARALGESADGTERALGALLDRHALECTGPAHAPRFSVPELLLLTALAPDPADTPGRGLVLVSGPRPARAPAPRDGRAWRTAAVTRGFAGA